MEMNDPTKFFAMPESPLQANPGRSDQIRLVQILYPYFQMDDRGFVTGMYRQFLEREPDPIGFQHFLRLLSDGMPRERVAGLILSEAFPFYSIVRTEPLTGAKLTAAAKIQQMMCGGDLFFIYALYEEFLCRMPDTDGLQGHFFSLTRGESRKNLLVGFLTSMECSTLLHASQFPNIQRPTNQRVQRQQKMIRVGLFLGYTEPLRLDGEGIGRYIVHLSENLLREYEHIEIHVSITNTNVLDETLIFQSTSTEFPDRFYIHRSDSVEWINRHVPVDVWIVPYVGLVMARHLDKPVILILHDVLHYHFPSLYYNRGSWLCQRLDRFIGETARHAALIVCSSSYVRQHDAVSFLGLPPDRVRIIRPAAPVRSSSINMSEHDFRMKYGIREPYFIFPSVARIHKNHDRLVTAFLRFRQSEEGRNSGLKLIFTDDKVNPFVSQIDIIRAQWPNPEVRNSINWLGRLPSQDLSALFRYSSGTVVPTLFEGSCPFPILESLLLHTPVAAGNLAVTREALETLDPFLPFDPYDVGELENSIRGLWQHGRNLVDKQRMAAHEALTRSWGEVAREFVLLIDEIT